MSEMDSVSVEKLDFLIDAVTALRQDMATILARLDELEADEADWFIRPIMPKGEVPDQDYFYSDEWQTAEAEADEDQRLGRHTVLNSADEARQHLRKLMEQPDEVPV